MMDNPFHRSLENTVMMSVRFPTSISLLAMSALGALLVGCSQPDPIRVVQDGVLDADRSMTVGAALGHYQDCREQTQQWSRYQTQRGTDIVQFKCELTGAKPYFTSLYSRTLLGVVTGWMSVLQDENTITPSADGKSIEALESLFSDLLNRLRAPDDLREEILSLMTPYKVNRAELVIEFAMDKTNPKQFRIFSTLLNLVWDDRTGTIPLTIDGTFAALYANHPIWNERLLGPDPGAELSEAWNAVEPPPTVKL